MQVQRLEIPDVIVVTPRKFGDHRGFFSETYKRDAYAQAGIDAEFVQDNQSLSAEPGTVRGLHFQHGVNAQAKLVRVVRGAIWDVAVDIRVGSPTYGRWVGAEISAANWAQIYVPVGFAHGFCTLEPDTEVVYKVSAPYDAPHEAGVMYNDPALGIDWKLGGRDAVLSEKDRSYAPFAALPAYFSYGSSGGV